MNYRSGIQLGRWFFGRWFFGLSIRRFSLFVFWKCDISMSNYAKLVQALRDQSEVYRGTSMVGTHRKEK